MNTITHPTVTIGQASSSREQMNIVIVGHVDHGKSTVIGRLMADTGSLPEGKLESVKAMCARNARPFEYAFLLDALKNEQAQGITIDTARCFFKTAKRDYIINDAPGHVEFLKNMITGAARAEAALLVIDAKEGIQENSKRHGYILSMLGVRQVAVLVNKMDLVDYSEEVFTSISAEYTQFLASLGVSPERFIPISAMEGSNITEMSTATSWYDGLSVLDQVDAFAREGSHADRPLRLPVQDIYKFTANNDDRRIVAGTIETGTVVPGDEVVFYPSGKRSTVKTIERFNQTPGESASAGSATGLTLTTQIYIKRGELLAKAGETEPVVATRFRANIFWMNHSPFIKGKAYKLKIGASRVPVELAEIRTVLDASELTSVQSADQIERHDVGEVVLETTRPVAFDLSDQLERTSRFVIVDEFEIAACGIILQEDTSGQSLMNDRVREREFNWETGAISQQARIAGYGHGGKAIIFTTGGAEPEAQPTVVAKGIAKQLERKLFASHKHTYYLSIGNVFDDLGNETAMSREEHIIQLGQLARLMTDSGLLFITTLTDTDDYDLEKLKLLNEPNDLFVVNVGESAFDHFKIDVQLDADTPEEKALNTIITELNQQDVIPDYCI
ncbi:MAG: GTP-binding protein [Planctomycetota bacterium]|jgi:bifunctional enzyme CysN/CysC